MRLKSIMALEDEAPLVIETVSAPFDPDQVIENDILQVEQDVLETKDIVNAIEDGEQASSALQDMAIQLLPTIEPDSESLKPLESQVISLAVEHFKKKINYSGTKAIPSLESFGGKMSRKDASKIALEQLTELVAEVDNQLQKAHFMEYSSQIKTIDSITKVRQNLLTNINQAGVNQAQFFTSDKYKSEHVGSELITGSYTKQLFNTDSALDGKMPVAAFIASLNDFNTSTSTNAYLPKLQEFVANLDSIVNTELTVESTANSFNKLYELFTNLITSDKTFVSTGGSNLFKYMHYPLTSSKLVLCYSSKECVDSDKYFSSSISIEKQVIKDDVKMCALSDQEATNVISIINGLTNNTSYLDNLTKGYELAISFLKQANGYYAKLNVTSDKDYNTFDFDYYKLKNLINNTLSFYLELIRYEVKVVSNVLAYTKDSVSFLSSKVVA